MQAATEAPLLSRASTSSIEEIIRLAFWLHTLRQFPQPMQRSGTTMAWLLEMLIALAGHSRTQV